MENYDKTKQLKHSIDLLTLLPPLRQPKIILLVFRIASAKKEEFLVLMI